MTFSKVCMLIGYFFNDCCFMARYFKETKSNRKFPNRVLFLLFQMDFKDKTTREVFATVQFYYDVDVVFPKAVLKPTLQVLASYSAIRFKPFATLLIIDVSGKAKRKFVPNEGRL